MSRPFDLSTLSFGKLLVYGREHGVGQPNREKQRQVDLADRIGRSIDATRLYEQDQQKPPEAVFSPRLKPGQFEADLRGILSFFTREEPDQDEIEFLAALQCAYENWPGGEGSDSSADDQGSDNEPHEWSEENHETEIPSAIQTVSAKGHKYGLGETWLSPRTWLWTAVGAIATVVAVVFAILQFVSAEPGNQVENIKNGNTIIQGDGNKVNKGDSK